jgi:hypothetical protein
MFAVLPDRDALDRELNLPRKHRRRQHEDSMYFVDRFLSARATASQAETNALLVWAGLVWAGGYRGAYLGRAARPRLAAAARMGPVPVGGLRSPSTNCFNTTALLRSSFLDANSNVKRRRSFFRS